MTKSARNALACAWIVLLTVAAMPAHAAKETKAEPAVIIQNQPDRQISPSKPPTVHTPIAGESPITGLPVAQGRYMPVLVQISNVAASEKVDRKTVTAAGLGKSAPWGGQYADIVYEGLLWELGQTRLTILFSDSLARGQPVSVGPVRSIRHGTVLLREEWQGVVVYSGGLQGLNDGIAQRLSELETDGSGRAIRMQGVKSALGGRVQGVKAPDNLDVNAVTVQNGVLEKYTAQPRPFLFFDENPYEGYERADTVTLDWGDKRKYYVSQFHYDELTGLYTRYCGGAPWRSFASAEDRSEENKRALTFGNVIIQRVSYDYPVSKLLPIPLCIGHGNADLLIGGRYIPGYWVRESETSPTVFLDDKGEEILLARGKTFIAHFPPESLLTVWAEKESEAS